MKKIFNTVLLFVMSIAVSCVDEKYEPATVTFYPTLKAELDEPLPGMEASPYTISLLASRPLAQETKVNVKIEGNGAGYGYSYTTFPPQLEPGIVTLTIPVGETSTFFNFTPMNDGIVEFQNYNYTFTIAEANGSVKSVGQGTFEFTVIEPPFYDEYFDNCTGIPAGLKEEIVPGAMSASAWGCTNFGYPEVANGTMYALEANAFGKGPGESNSYLIIDQAINDPTFTEVFVSAQVYSRFSGAGILKMLYSTNYSGTGNPEAEGVIWTEVPGTASLMPSAGSQEWTTVEGTLTGIEGQMVYIAFQYIGGTTTSASNWRIDDVILKVK
jgi:hypothetical protein